MHTTAPGTGQETAPSAQLPEPDEGTPVPEGGAYEGAAAGAEEGAATGAEEAPAALLPPYAGAEGAAKEDEAPAAPEVTVCMVVTVTRPPPP